MTNKREANDGKGQTAIDDAKKVRNTKSRRNSPTKQAQVAATAMDVDPEQYDIEEVENYDKPLLVQIVKLHHERMLKYMHTIHIWEREQRKDAQRINELENENKQLKQSSNSTVTVQDKDSLNNFGSASITGTQVDGEEENEEDDDNEYYRNLAIVEENKRYTPGITATDDESRVNGNGNGKSSKQQERQQTRDTKNWNGQGKEKVRTTYVQKYHYGDLVAEAIVIGRKPYFAVAAPKVGNPDEVSITLQDSIPIDDNMVVKPFEPDSYINKPYTFKSEQEFAEFVQKTKEENLDSLYRTVKSIIKKYVDADDFHISICAADTVFTYFQDKIGLTHYLFFIGGNNSGKTNNITVLHFLTYRNMMSSGMTAANVYQFLGSGEEGTGTICEDEADNIDEDRDRMKVYKNGYTTGIPYHRTDTSVGRQQLKFNTFCFKAFAAEKLPDSVTAKGFNQRIIELPCVYGFPKYDISEVVNPAGEEEYQHLLDELLDVRNRLLIYRLLHFKEKIPDIKLNIQNREKQLFKPILRVFQHTEILNVLLPVISKYVGQKRESNANTLHAFLYKLITKLIKAQNTYELESNLIWNTIKEELQGKDIPYKPQSHDTIEFGLISQKGIIQTLKEVFGAKPPDKRHGNSRALVFDKSKLERLSKIYDLEIEVQVTTGSNSPHLPHLPHVGLDRHIEDKSQDNTITKKQEQICNNSKEIDREKGNVTSLEEDKDNRHFQQVAEVAEVAEAITKESTTIKEHEVNQQVQESIYRLGHSDIWACKNCRLTGDIHFMKNHICRGSNTKK